MKSLLYHTFDTILWRITIGYYIGLDYLNVISKPYSRHQKNLFFHYLGGFHDAGNTPWDFFLRYHKTDNLIWNGTKWQIREDDYDYDYDTILDKIISDILIIRKNLHDKGFKI